MNSLDSFQTLDSLKVGGKEYAFYNIAKLHEKFPAIQKLPKSKKILIENLLRLEDGKDVNKDLIEKVLQNPEENMKYSFFQLVCSCKTSRACLLLLILLL